MKKILLYLPAMIHTAATICLNLISGALIPLWHIWNILFWLSGWLMGRGKVWGCIPGLLPGGMILCMKWGRPWGIEAAVAGVWTAYYLLCGFLTWKKGRSTKTT